MARTRVINEYDNCSTNIACRYCNNNCYDEFSKERPVVPVHVCQWNNIDNERNYATVQLYEVPVILVKYLYVRQLQGFLPLY